MNDRIAILHRLISIAGTRPHMTIDRIIVGVNVARILDDMVSIYTIEAGRFCGKRTIFGYPVSIDYDDPDALRIAFEEWSC